MDNQPNIPVNSTPPQAPVVQPAPAESLQQPAAPMPKERKGLKTAGGLASLLFGAFTAVIGLLQAQAYALIGIVVLGLGVFWLVTGILILKSSLPQKTSKLLHVASLVAVFYTGILLMGAFFVPLFKFSAVLLPLVYAIAIAVISNRYSKNK